MCEIGFGVAKSHALSYPQLILPEPPVVQLLDRRLLYRGRRPHRVGPSAGTSLPRSQRLVLSAIDPRIPLPASLMTQEVLVCLSPLAIGGGRPQHASRHRLHPQPRLEQGALVREHGDQGPGGVPVTLGGLGHLYRPRLPPKSCRGKSRLKGGGKRSDSGHFGGSGWVP